MPLTGDDVPYLLDGDPGHDDMLAIFLAAKHLDVVGVTTVSGNQSLAKVTRNAVSQLLYPYGIASLKREKDDAKEVREGMECGIRLEHFNDIKEGDLLEAYKIEEVKRTLE